MTDICREMGVRTDVPFRDLTEQRKGHRLPRPRGEEAHLLPQQELQPGGRAGLHLLQRRLYRGKRTRQGQGREGHEARRKIPEGRGLPGLPRHAPVRCRPRAEAARHFAGRGLHDDALGAVSTGCSGVPDSLPEEMRPMAESICEAFESTAKRLHRPGARLPDARPLGLHALHRRAAAHAARPRRAQPHDRRSLCARRAVHRSAPVEHRGPDRRDARSRRRRQLRHLGRPRHADSEGSRLDRRNGPRSGR